MEQVLEYTVVHDSKAEKLASKVNELIKSGWQLLGAAVINTTSMGSFPTYHFYQTMVKYQS